MFDSLSDRLGGVFDRLRGRGALSEEDVRARCARCASPFSKPDVALPVVREFIDKVTEQAVGQSVLKSITPGQQVVKIVHDGLVAMLRAEASDLDLEVTPPAVIMLVGLQGSGKTTSTAKIARRLKGKSGKKVMMASLDVYRPAAQEQLAVLGTQAEVATLPIVAGQQPVDIARRALQAAKLQGSRRADARHGGAAPCRPGADGRDARRRRGGAAAGDPARRRFAHRPGRGERRQELHRPGAADRRGADPHGRRCARRRGALDARRHGAADQVRRHGREAGRAGALPAGARGRPHPRHGRRGVAGRARGRDDQGRGGGEARPSAWPGASST